MKIDAYKGNPIVKTFGELQELERRALQIDPDFFGVKILPDKVILERYTRRTFKFKSTPSMDWVLSKIKFMNDKNL